MRKIFLIAVGIVALAACGGGGDSGADSAPATSAPPAAAATVDPATAGTITGKITLEGEPSDMDVIQMAADPNCAKMHDSPVQAQFVVVGEGGGLANAFVHIKSGLNGSFPAPSEPALLDQQGCIYVPHVIGLQVGQPLKIRNSDATLHNIHATPSNNKEFNIGQPVQGLETERTFDAVEVMVPFKCDVHKWMNSYAGVVDHPYFAVTDANGDFSMDNVPPGEYTVEVWHEKFGTQEMSVSLGESATAEANGSYTAS